MLALLGDSITTDHISPAGDIAIDSPAGKYLIEHGIEKAGLQHLRHAARQSRSHDPGDVRQYPPAQPARPRQRRRRHHAPARRRGDEHLRRLGEVHRRRHAAGRDGGRGIRHRVEPRLGGERHDAARRQGGHRQVVRAHPPQQSGHDGRAAAPVQRGRRCRSRSA